MIMKINSPAAAKKYPTLIILGFGLLLSLKIINRILTVVAKIGMKIAKNCDGFILISPEPWNSLCQNF
jgi:hypothetical protein